MDKKENKQRSPWFYIVIIVGILAVLVLGIVSMNNQNSNSQTPNTNNNQNSNNQAPDTNPSQNQYLTPEQQCQNNGGTWCNSQCYSSCPTGENFFCSSSGQSGCVVNQNSSLSNNSFTTYTDQAPYYGAYCDKIDPYNLNVREASSLAIKNNPGSYNINQLLDIYDWVKKNIEYQSVTSPNIPYPPDQTLATSSGDCKNQAVLIASMVEAIGGTAKVVADPSCNHAYALVYISNQSQDMQSIIDTISKHYNQQLYIQWITSGNENWLIFDPAGGLYPGNTLPECSGTRTVYYVNSCLSCEEQYPNMPYTFGNSCYSQCPSGTVSVNGHDCSYCQAGEYSYNNQCVTCPSGYYLAVNGRCYPN